jgi:DNA-binding MarR family transcriptional regulator
MEDLRPVGDPGSEEFQVDAYPFYLLNRTVSRYNTLIDAELRGIELEIPMWRVLMILGEQSPLPVAGIARLAVINLSTMMRILARMAKAGFVDDQPSADDLRVREIFLTDLGREKLAAARTVTAPFYRKLIRGFSAADFSRLRDLLNRLHDNLA